MCYNIKCLSDCNIASCIIVLFNRTPWYLFIFKVTKKSRGQNIKTYLLMLLILAENLIAPFFIIYVCGLYIIAVPSNIIFWGNCPILLATICNSVAGAL